MKKYVSGSSMLEDDSLLAIFWYTGKGFVGPEDTLDSKRVVLYGDYLQIDKDHFNVWDRYKGYTDRPDVEYDYFPRGRILFNTALHKFVVVTDEKICNDPRIKEALLEWYSLPATTIFRSDEHYQSEADV